MKRQKKILNYNNIKKNERETEKSFIAARVFKL